MKKIRAHKRKVSTLLILTMFLQIGIPAISVAGTGDDQQVEFSPSGGGGEMVNMYNGALNYSIPLLSIPGQNIGYDITLGYNSDDVKMMNDASFVGFGWNLNIGNISRQVQAVPDDFDGDVISYLHHAKPFKMTDISLGKLSSSELAGLPIQLPEKTPDGPNTDYTGSLYWDNYTGLGIRVGFNKSTKKGLVSYSTGLELDSKRGIGYNLSGQFSFISLGVSGQMIGGLSAVTTGFSGIGPSASTGILFNSMISPPSIPMRTRIKTGTAKLGFPAIETGQFKKFVQHNNSGLLGSLIGTTVESNTLDRQDLPAYGYMYKGSVPVDEEKSVKDFIRYSFPYSKGTSFLPSSQLGNDIFIQSDQGSGGVFTARTRHVDVWSTSNVESQTRKTTIGGEFSLASNSQSFHAGVERLDGEGTTYSGKPSDKFTSKLGVNSEEDNGSTTYLVKNSEVQIEPLNNTLASWGNDQPGRMKMSKGIITGEDGERWGATGQLQIGSAVNSNTSYSSVREAFKEHSKVEYLTANEVQNYGRTKYIGAAASNGINEINVWETNGLVYSYGDPVSNHKRSDVMFSLDHVEGTTFTQGVNVNEFEKDIPDGNNSKSATSGDFITYGKGEPVIGGFHTGMELLNVTKVPSYATSWPVQMITSDDYYDVLNDGPSNDDFGSWVKFSYETTSNNYRWRMPYEGVSVTDGVKGKSGDDVGFYRYGEKDVKYIKQIETKTHIAEFVYPSSSDARADQRHDGYPVKDQSIDVNGGIDNSISSNPIKKLKEIRLYLKRNDTQDPNDRTLVQSIFFEYDYSLAPGEPSNYYGGGKLTLKKVYTTFYNSEKGKDYKYEFNYGDETSLSNNPSYNRANMDRWGDYKKNYIETTRGNFSVTSKNYPFQDFPFAEENNNEGQDLRGDAAPWCLKSVDLPTGATLKIEYEDRDYAYVENKAATKMYDIVSVDNLRNGFQSQISEIFEARRRTVYGPNTDMTEYYKADDLTLKNHVAVELPASIFETMTSTERDKYFFNNYLKGIDKELYVKAYLNLENVLKKEEEQDYGYVELMSKLDDDPTLFGISTGDTPYKVYEVQSGNVKHYFGLINLDPVFTQLDVKNVLDPLCFTPMPAISAAGIEHIKNERSEIFYGKLGDKSSINPTQALELISASIKGLTCTLRTKGHANKIRLNGWSKIRLKDPLSKKIGGGYRVKSVVLDDNWDQGDSQNQNTIDESYSYKQVYSYTTVDEDGRTISSGVAVEPLVGREENADYKLYYYKEKVPLTESNTRHVKGHPLDFHNTGIGVGYSKVTVNTEYPILASGKSIERSIAPTSVYEFNTSKDYPFIKKSTNVSKEGSAFRRFASLPGFWSIAYEDRALTQGYVGIKNDMAGKLKKITKLNRAGEIISGQEYIYHGKKESVPTMTYSPNFKTMEPGKPDVIDHLKNDGILTLNSGIFDINKRDLIEGVRIGEDYDIWIDANENSERMDEVGDFEFGIGLMTTQPWFLYLMPRFGEPVNSSSTINKQIVLNKMIYRKGILKTVNTEKNQSNIRTEYLAYDQQTAAPLLTRVDNEFHDSRAQEEQTSLIDSRVEPRIYKFTRPAYWEYSSVHLNTPVVHSNPFLGAYFNLGKTVDCTIDVNGFITTNGSNVLSDGDQVYATIGGFNYHAFAKKELDGNNYRFKLYPADFSAPLLDASGSGATLKIINSGNTNLINTSVGELVFQHLGNFSDGHSLEMDSVLNASAITFNSEWGKICCLSGDQTLLNNPFITGERNRWMPYQSFVFHNERLYQEDSYSKRGLIYNFTPFNWQQGAATNWVVSSTALKYDIWGNLIEQNNALNLPSFTMFGYQETVVTAATSNSSSSESGQTSFEEATYDSCEENGGINVTEDLEVNNDGTVSDDVHVSPDKSHTGKYSLKVNPGAKHLVTKKINCASGN